MLDKVGLPLVEPDAQIRIAGKDGIQVPIVVQVCQAGSKGMLRVLSELLMAVDKYSGASALCTSQVDPHRVRLACVIGVPVADERIQVAIAIQVA